MSSSKDTIDIDQVNAIISKVYPQSNDIKVLEHHLEAYSKDKVGFLGTHQHLEITVAEKDKPKKLHFFVKSIPKDSADQMAFVKERRVFNQEAEFFNKVNPQLLDAVAVGKVEPWAPKCYLANDELVVLEDLKSRGFAMCEDKILKGDYLKAAVKAMARLHAASMITEHKLAEPLNKIHPHACREQMFNDYIRQHLLALFESFIGDVSKKHGRSSQHVHKVSEYAFDYVNKGREDERVICHGDAWPNNIMFDKSSPPKCILVDYQIVRYAPRMFDVAELIYTSTTRDIRRKEEKEAIECYYEELSETLRKCNPSIDIPSLEKIREEYEHARIAGLVITLIYFPTILLSKKVFTEYKEDPAALYRKFIFRQNNDCVLELMEKDETYGDRITEAILEFVELAEKFATV